MRAPHALDELGALDRGRELRQDRRTQALPALRVERVAVDDLNRADDLAARLESEAVAVRGVDHDRIRPEKRRQLLLRERDDGAAIVRPHREAARQLEQRVHVLALDAVAL